MKCRVKKICTISLAVIIPAAAILLWHYAADNHSSGVPSSRESSVPQWIKINKTEVPQLKLERYRNGFDESFSVAENQAANELGSRIQKCAATVLKAVLPEKAELIAPLETTLLDEYSAVVLCRAVIFAADGKNERRLKCRIKINYLADGSCEAEYPEFFSDK